MSGPCDYSRRTVSRFQASRAVSHFVKAAVRGSWVNGDRARPPWEKEGRRLLGVVHTPWASWLISRDGLTPGGFQGPGTQPSWPDRKQSDSEAGLPPTPPHRTPEGADRSHQVWMRFREPQVCCFLHVLLGTRVSGRGGYFHLGRCSRKIGPDAER